MRREWDIPQIGNDADQDDTGLAIQTGFVGVKAVLNMFEPAAGAETQEVVLPRLPCSPLAGEALEKITKGMHDIAKYERKLRESGYRGGSFD